MIKLKLILKNGGQIKQVDVQDKNIVCTLLNYEQNSIILLISLFTMIEENALSNQNLKIKQLRQPYPSGMDRIDQSKFTQVDLDHELNTEGTHSTNGATIKKVRRIKLQQDNLFLNDREVGEKMENQKLKTKTFIFGIALLLTQITVCLVYGFKFQVVVFDNTWEDNVISFEPIAFTVLTLFAALVGFPMLFAYNIKMIWTALFFNLFILCLSLEIYFIANNLINRIGINPSLQNYSSYWHIYIWNYDYHQLPLTQYSGTYYQAFGNTLIDGIKCGISNMIIYSAVLGRVGILQVFILTVIGTIGYEFCRQILFSLGTDFGDGCSMWVYGGFAGFIIGLIEYFKNRNNIARSTKQSILYTGSFYSTGFSMIGSTVLVILLPILCIHAPRKIFEKYPNLLSNVPYSVWHSTVTSIITSIATSVCINGKVAVRDFINGAIAGGITGFNSALFIKIPAYAQVVGFTAGLFQSLAQNFVEKTIAMRFNLFHSFSFTLFGLQGIIGAGFGSIFQNSSVFSTQTIVLGAIAVGLGVGFGLVIQIFIFFIGSHGIWDNFHDKVYMSDIAAEPFKDEFQVMLHQLNIQQDYRPGRIPFD